jgi:hypothetical protein
MNGIDEQWKEGKNKEGVNASNTQSERPSNRQLDWMDLTPF